jgi:alkylated DNA repair protein (DNA oxidative demethylase)
MQTARKPFSREKTGEIAANWTKIQKVSTPMDGFRLISEHLDSDEQAELVCWAAEVVAKSPFFQPTMPRSGKPFSVVMTNAGPLGWVADKQGGYRYQACHPETHKPWPALSPRLLEIWQELSAYTAEPECCLINYYGPPKAKMGLHQDRDEEETAAPVLSISLGDTALFRIGSTERRGPTKSVRLRSGDVVLLSGQARHAYHGIDRVQYGSSRLLAACGFPRPEGRLNLTLRRVTTTG